MASPRELVRGVDATFVVFSAILIVLICIIREVALGFIGSRRDNWKFRNEGTTAR